MSTPLGPCFFHLSSAWESKRRGGTGRPLFSCDRSRARRLDAHASGRCGNTRFPGLERRPSPSTRPFSLYVLLVSTETLRPRLATTGAGFFFI